MRTDIKPVLIVGAGISGLSTAYWLTKSGVPCVIHEKSGRTGGLISTKITPYGLVESAANGFLAGDDVADLCEDVGVRLAEVRPERTKRYIFRGRPRRWPLSFSESLRFFKGICKFFFSRRAFFNFKPGQSIGSWAGEKFGPQVTEWLIAPALQGVYAGNVNRMSAGLILGGFLKNRTRKKTRLKGTCAPEGGMGELINRLEGWLEHRGVRIQKNSAVENLQSVDHSAIVIATSVFDYNDLAERNPGLLAPIQVENLPLVSTTVFFERDEMDLKGFGCLFPKREGFYSLGALFNNCIFEGRSQQRSETWIMGGAFNKEICRWEDGEILRQIKEDRKRVYPGREEKEPLFFQVTRWPKGLPHINTELEAQIEDLKLSKGIHLSGNYLGRIGVGQMISRNKDLAQSISSALAKDFP